MDNEPYMWNQRLTSSCNAVVSLGQYRHDYRIPMNDTMTFSDIIDAADNLSVDEQETLVEILQHRIAKRNRDALVRDVDEARTEFQDGNTQTTSLSEIMDEVRGES